MSTPFTKVLIANRGEIACRIIETLRTMGIQSVAVYSDADANAKHVQLADEAVNIGPAPATESYLNIANIVRAAHETGAQAVHPGYGFLSENQDFASALDDAGITFIGPSVHSLHLMGDKIRSKNHVKEHGVPVVPGISEPGLTDAQLEAAAEDIGYPILIKPSAGGGGKGMESVQSATDLKPAIETARRVAAKSFGDDTLFLERLVQTPRHIEIQVLADKHGNVIHLGERECSLQRRHQKVIEEAPSALLTEEQRERMGQAAVAAAKSVDYWGAGTVEFLLSNENPDEFFFMEMNTRLQVEHPVTEMVTGIDLVEQQVRIAQGEPLDLASNAVELQGHAVEARVYAENPAKDFLPSTGTIQYLDEPTGPGIRVDSALVDGLEISAHYDPMLAKVIAWAPDRTQALARLDEALGTMTVLGVDTNIDFLRALLADPDAQAGRLDTGLIERKLDTMTAQELPESALHFAAQALVDARRSSAEEHAGDPWFAADGWQLAGARPGVVTLVRDGQRHRVTVPAGTADAEDEQAPDGIAVVQRNIGATEDSTSADVWLKTAGFAGHFAAPSRAELIEMMLDDATHQPGAASPDVRSPMPGTVVAVAVESGQAVSAGQVLASVEAMKMEHHMRAEIDGTVTISVKPGDVVRGDQVVATVTPAEPASDTPADTPDPSENPTN